MHDRTLSWLGDRVSPEVSAPGSHFAGAMVCQLWYHDQSSSVGSSYKGWVMTSHVFSEQCIYRHLLTLSVKSVLLFLLRGHKKCVDEKFKFVKLYD